MTTIDPSKVKAGDTVTVAGTNTAHLEYTVTGVVWEPSHSPGQLWVGPVALDATTLTITDHQPAEPEWEPGTVYEIDSGYGNPGEAAWCIRDLRGVIFVTADGDEFAPEELDSIQVLPDDTEALRAEVERLEAELHHERTGACLSCNSTGVIDSAEHKCGMCNGKGYHVSEWEKRAKVAEAEVERLRAARPWPTHEQVAEEIAVSYDDHIDEDHPNREAFINNAADRVLDLFEQGGER